MTSQWWPFWKRSVRKSARKPFRATPRFDTLEDRSVPAVVSITPAADALEGNAGKRDIVFTVTLDAPDADPISVLPETESDTATMGTDFDGGGDFLNFAPGEISKQFIVKINGDTDVEPDETFKVKFSAVKVGNVTIPANTFATGTIKNDDTPPPAPPAPPPPPIPQGAPPAVVRTNSTFAGAQVVAPPDARLETTPVDKWLNVASEASKGEPAYYKLSMPIKFGLAIDVQKAGIDPPGIITEIYDANQNLIAATLDFAKLSGIAPFSYSDAEGEPNDAGMYQDLQAGTYFVKAWVPFGSAKFTLSFLTDTVYSTTVPIFESNPGAPVAVLLDFDGYSSNSPTDGWIQPGFTTSYKINPINIRGQGHAGDAGTFSPAERLFMANTWKEVAEDYSMFNMNVTTREQPLVQNGVPLGVRAIIENKDEVLPWQTQNVSGFAKLDGMSFYPGEAPSFSYVTSKIQDGAGDDFAKNVSIMKGLGDTVSHEVGHTFGLQHQWGIKTTVPNIVPGGPTLGIGLAGVVSGGSKYKSDDNANMWVVGTTTPGKGEPPVSLQSDMDVIASAKNRAGYRPDEAGSNIAGAAALAAVGPTFSRSAVIAKSDDIDVFSFTASGKTTINVNVGSYAADPGLITMITLIDSTGATVATGDKARGGKQTQDIHGTLTTRTSDSDGTITLPFTVGIAVGDLIAISWGEGNKVVSRQQVKVADINGNVITIAKGERAKLPAAGSQVIAAVPMLAGASSITRDLAAGTYYLKIAGIGRRVTDTVNTLIEDVGAYSIKIVTGAAPAGQPANQAPVVALQPGGITYKSKADPIVIDAAAKVTDDDPNFNGGVLTITLAGGTADDTIAIESTGDVHSGFGGINFKQAVVGDIAGGTAGNPLVLTFKSDTVTAEVVQAFLRNVSFSSVAPITALGGPRTVTITLKDRRGATSAPVSKTITLTAPDRQSIKLVNNTGLTVPTNAPKAFGNAELKISAPDGPLGPQTVTYTVTQVPANGKLLLQLPSDDPQSPNFLPLELHVGDQFTQNNVDNGFLAYRLAPGSTANDDQWSFTATDLVTGTIADTVVKIRVTRGAAPQAGAPGAPIAAEEGIVVPPEASGDPNIFLTITNKHLVTVIPSNRLSYQTEDGDPRNVAYEIVDVPQFGTLNLVAFTQKTIDDNGLVYSTPLVADIPAGIDRDWFTFVVRDLTTGGVSDPITYVIGLQNPNDRPFFIDGTNEAAIGPILPFGEHAMVTPVQELLQGVFNDPDYVPGVQSGFGLAVTGVDNTHGQWSYSIDSGDTWIDITGVSLTHALVLSGYYDTTLVRFDADVDYVGVAQLQFHLWDEFDELPSGEFADLTSDSSNAYSVASGVVTVNTVEKADKPSFSGGAPVTTHEDAGVVVVSGWATNIVGDHVADVEFLVAESDNDDNTLEFIQFPSISANGALTFEVAPNQSGVAHFQVSIPSVFGDSDLADLIITVQEVNDAPTITIGPGISLSAAAGAVTVPGWATGISAVEADQTLVVEIATDNSGLFEVKPTLDLVTGTLTYRPKVDGAGTANVFLTLTDSGGAATTRSFTLTVTPALPVSADTIKLIKNVYQDLLGRQPEANGLLGWANVLSVGFTPAQFMDAVLHSPEYTQKEVTRLYQTYLGHSPDTASLDAFSSFMQQGGSIRQVESAVLATAEYFAIRGGGSNAGFTAALFQNVLGRPIDAATSATVVAFLDAGGSRSAIVDMVLNSSERAGVYVQAAYQKFLGRAADSLGLASLSNVYLTSGENAVIKLLLGSAEYAAQP